MLHVLICEDDPTHRAQMESIVHKHITTEDCEMELVLSAGGPISILDYLEAHPDTNGLYFLDVVLQYDEMNGIELAAKIREIDARATIVFVTTHEELSYLVFKYKIEAMDYIIKDRPEDMEARAIECMLLAYKRYLADKTTTRNYYQVKTGDQVLNIPYDEILFFETHPAMRNKMVLHMDDRHVEFRGHISALANIDPAFYRCHQSFVVNTKQIKCIDKGGKEIEMNNGARVPVASRKISELLKLME
ncbi:MAG: LytTR family DNA-binding domain-containing protein [Oscillospiraceae bacterium]|nr:LytTR family DNA-binding domain-containing protein [Oscillospiraceae bacterium]